MILTFMPQTQIFTLQPSNQMRFTSIQCRKMILKVLRGRFASGRGEIREGEIRGGKGRGRE